MSQGAASAAAERFPLERYEEARRAAVGVATRAANSLGLALLMRRGMVAWMRAWVSCTAAPPRQHTEPTQHPTVSPEIVTVLAEMALAAAREVAA